MDDNYVVEWSMPLTADNPVDAAVQALGIHRDPGSVATVFFVTRNDGARWKVDLEADGTLVSTERVQEPIERDPDARRFTEES